MNTTGILQKSNNWQDFKAYIRLLSKKQKGDCFEVLTKNFLELNPKYVSQLKNVWYLHEVPNRVRKYLNLPAPDEGIDLIAETKDSAYWAIQCKYKEDENKSLTRKELSTFTDLAFGICKNIELGLVCTSTNRFSHKLTLYRERLSFCAGDVWCELKEEFFCRLHDYLDHKAVPLEPLKPKEHQKTAIKQAFQHFVKEKGSRGKLIQPCGTGKTLTGYWITQKLGAKTIIVAMPSLLLIRKTLEVWARESVANHQDIHWIAVCSDDSVGDFGKEDVAVLTQDLGIRVHTDPDEITKWLEERKQGTTIVFTTYQSGRITAKAASKAGIIFDVGIMDEAHKTAGKKDGLFSHLLYDENIKIKHRIFMTATERRYLGNSDQIASMDDIDLYGETFELLTFKEAFECSPPILSDYKIVTIQVTRSEIAKFIERNIFVKPNRGKWDTEVEAQSFAAIIALRKAMKKRPISHTISFHNSIARAAVFKVNQDRFSAAFPEYGELDTFHVSGKTPTAERSRLIDVFEDSRHGLVTNARCLTEGVDIPNIDCVLFADPKGSTIDIVQAVGRALRLAKDKKYGYVVIPVLLDDKETDETALQTDVFDAVLMTLRALAANDERIIEYFRSISQGKQRVRGTSPMEIDIPEGMVVDAENFVNSVELHCWSRLAKLSWRPFEEARAFVHGLMLKTGKEWKKYCRGELPEKETKPQDIPAAPAKVYKNKGWIGVGDWLGTGTVASFEREYRPFKEARAFVHGLKLENWKEWEIYCRGDRPEDIPTNPKVTYKNKGWIRMGDWLGTGNVATFEREYRPFKEARAFVHGLMLKTGKEWKKYCRGELPEKETKPQDIPADPYKVYKDKGWIRMGDWLGTGNVATFEREYRPFKEARAFVHGLMLKTGKEWKKYLKGELPEKGTKPQDIPANPNVSYKDKGWIGVGDWLGTGTVATRSLKFRPFKEARAFVHGLKLKGDAEWRKYRKGELPEKGTKPQDIPATPAKVYKDKGWNGTRDWLGTNR